MADIPTREAEIPQNIGTPQRISINTMRHPSGLLMTHSSQPLQAPPTTINIGGINLTGRTAEHSRNFANNISTAIEEIRPLLEHARINPGISLTSWLNIQRQEQSITPQQGSDSYVINLDNQPSTSTININQDSTNDHLHYNYHHTTATDNFLNNIREAANAENQSNNNNADEGQPSTLRLSGEARAMLEVIEKYVPFLLMLLSKVIYDQLSRILNLLALLFAFIYVNDLFKREVAKRQHRSQLALLRILCFIGCCIVLIYFMDDDYIYKLIPYAEPHTVWELLWTVAIRDIMLKLITIVFKVILNCLPAGVLGFQKRGKYYLMIEATSQLYRSLAPIQPWLYYLFDSYKGPESVISICLTVVYSTSKSGDIVSRAKLFRTAAWKIFQNVKLGVSPSKEQLMTSGGVCAICLEEFTMPVRLHCKHIFCEGCVLTWLDRERSCPLCRTPITDVPIYRDGHTTYFIQLF
ncbi:RING finger and transmembrane domain-containing protein 2 [Cephus cinctus]|uniref:RING finger and transmembrane domain-containing protein 2 n=1 Tax=Cephus cinctus TaxID=211228 RepID=A0AAJ7FI95_CEPCN|nr:RING finger and transmembrane domain-containing protein 2 [Cephus cinctus]XP_015593161.1 RING finger and transmembrane domain-containing protein 2 [Cephus cinctus]